MGDDGFAPVGDSEEALYGPPGVLASGFAAGEQSTLRTIVERARPDVPLVFVGGEHGARTPAELLALADGTGGGADSPLPRAVVLSGLTERQLQAVMAGYRAAGLPRPLWAALTPTSEQWSLARLLEELAAEAAAFARGGG
jgi:hypothetical protein